VLLLDVGNSRSKWARIENGFWAQQGVADNSEWLSHPSRVELLSPPSRIIISNVAGEEMARLLRDVCSKWSAQVEFVMAREEQCGVRNNYLNPLQLGSDRWAALIAARHRIKRACLVVNCGTATTVDALADDGEFLGGLILPGVTLMQQSLLHNTAQLKTEEGQLENFPRKTNDAIHSGVIRATTGAIEYQRLALKLECSSDTIPCVLSGGAAGKIEKHLGMDVERVDNLVLEGLKIIGEASA
jgi:type III pantothenate kinase